MKRILMCLLALTLLLAACNQTPQEQPMIQPVRFYYRTARTDFSAEEGIIRSELRELGEQTYSDLEIFRLYFRGPSSPELVSPMTQDTELADVFRSGGTLELRLRRGLNTPTEFDHALTYACLAKTGLELEGVRKVHIRVNSFGGTLLSDVTLTQSDILLYDSGEAPEFMELTLYYTDETSGLLLTEKRQIPLLSSEELPQKAMELLLTAPQTAGLRSALPPGTALLDLSVENGVCTVDFNRDFYNNRPETEQGEQLAVLSVVNTLCELDEINQVQIYVEGRKLERYVYLDLSTPWLLDGTVMGPIREELGEFSATLCLPGERDNSLHRLKFRARARGGASKEAALLRALFERASQNGLYNPLFGLDAPVSVSTEGRLCRVNLARHQLPEDELARKIAIRCITATLCSLPDLRSVEIWQEGTLITPQPFSPESSWFFVQ